MSTGTAVDLDALAVSLRTEGWKASMVAAGLIFASAGKRANGDLIEWCISDQGVIKADVRPHLGVGSAMMPFDAETFREFDIIRSHLAPVPAPDELRERVKAALASWYNNQQDHPHGPGYFMSVDEFDSITDEVLRAIEGRGEAEPVGSAGTG